MRADPIRRTLLLVAVASLAACGGGTQPPPEPGTTRGFPPDLRGRRVMLLPVQSVLGVAGDADAELAFGLRERGGGVEWILPADIERMLARSPNVRASTRGLPVGLFLQAEVQRVGDPLYGELRRMAALVDAEAVLIPVQAALEATPPADPTIRFWTTLIESRTGRVLWFSVIEGRPFPAGDPRALATAVEAVARTLLWYGGA